MPRPTPKPAQLAALLSSFLLGVVSAFWAVRRRRRRRLPARSVIISSPESTVVGEGGTVRSVQSAEITLSDSDLERLWTPANLQNLGRTYWLFLSRVTLRLIRVIYRPQERLVRLAFAPITLLRFDAPEYTVEPDRGYVRWRIKDGLLVARPGRANGWLALEVKRLGPAEQGRAKLRIEVEVANFYPSIATAFSMPVYKRTQAFVHVLVTHSFLRSLAALDLDRSELAPFSAAGQGAAELVPATGGSLNGHTRAAAAE